jgi:hypothetical protein
MKAWIEDSYPRMPVSEPLEIEPDRMFRFIITEACNTSRLRLVLSDTNGVRNVSLNARPVGLDLIPSNLVDIKLTIRECAGRIAGRR